MYILTEKDVYGLGRCPWYIVKLQIVVKQLYREWLYLYRAYIYFSTSMGYKLKPYFFVWKVELYFFILLYSKYNYFKWCVNFCCTASWISYMIHISPSSWSSPLNHPTCLRSSQSTKLSSLCYAAASH